METHPSLLHLPHLSTVGFSSAIMWPLMLLALLMPTAMLPKTVNLCLPVAFAAALFFLVLHPDRLKALFAFSLSQRTIAPSCWTVLSTVWQNENECTCFLRQIDDFIIIFTRLGFRCNSAILSLEFFDCGWQKTRQTCGGPWSLLTVQIGTIGCKAESWRAEVVMSLCLHANLLLCSAQQHCPPAPSSLPTLVPPGRRFHHTLT